MVACAVYSLDGVCLVDGSLCCVPGGCLAFPVRMLGAVCLVDGSLCCAHVRWCVPGGWWPVGVLGCGGVSMVDGSLCCIPGNAFTVKLVCFL